MFRSNYILGFVLSLFFLASCSKDNIDKIDEQIDTVNPKTTLLVNGLIAKVESRESNDVLDLGCIQIEYPFSMKTSTGKVLLVTSDETFEEVVTNSQDSIADFVYPLNVIDHEGTKVIVSTAIQLSELFANCVPEGGWDDFFYAYHINFDNSCYELQFPLQLNIIDSLGTPASVATVNTEEELNTVIASKFATFKFPIKLKENSALGAIVTVNSGQELTDLLYACNGVWPDGDSLSYECVQLVFPLSVKLTDGGTLVINSEEDFFLACMNADVEGFVYPIQVKSQGQTVTVTSDEQFESLVEDCSGVVNIDNDLTLLFIGATIPGQDGMLCYSIVYPFNVSKQNGSVQNVISFDALTDLFSTGEFYALLYPVSIIKKNGQTVVLNSSEDLFELINDCN